MKASWYLTVFVTVARRLNLLLVRVIFATDTFGIAEGTTAGLGLFMNTCFMSSLRYFGRCWTSSSLISPPPCNTVLNSRPLWTDTGRKGLSFMTPITFRMGKFSPSLTALLLALRTST